MARQRSLSSWEQQNRNCHQLPFRASLMVILFSLRSIRCLSYGNRQQSTLHLLHLHYPYHTARVSTALLNSYRTFLDNHAHHGCGPACSCECNMLAPTNKVSFTIYLAATYIPLPLRAREQSRLGVWSFNSTHGWPGSSGKSQASVVIVSSC